jgi:hypothetical protein
MMPGATVCLRVCAFAENQPVILRGGPTARPVGHLSWLSLAILAIAAPLAVARCVAGLPDG